MSYSSDNISLVRANTNSEAFDSGNITDLTVNAYANLFFPYVLDSGGNNNVASLTITVLNDFDLKDDTEDLPNKQWVGDYRLRNSFLTYKPIWGFKEAFHAVKKSHSLSNAFCFVGQKLNFYIAQKGHDAGTINGEWIYAKTTLTVKEYDVVSGSEQTLYTFDSFEDDLTSSSRFFNWTVPSANNNLFSSYSLFGLCVIVLEIENTYYEDAERTIAVTTDLPSSNRSYLQVLIYSGAREIIDVNGGNINILNSIPSSTDTLEQIFSKTIFENLSSSNLNALTTAQKRAIMADQIAVLFASQHPVITADFAPSYVIGAGGEAAVSPRKIIDRAFTYTKKYPEVIPMIVDRLYGMFANYKAFNFAFEIESLFTDFTQSIQSIRDPVRTILMDENGVIADDLGVDGLIFNPFALDIMHSEISSYKESTMSISCPLYDSLVDINSIDITNSSGGTILPYSNDIKVSFSVVYGDSYISQIRYTIVTEKSLNYAYYIDTTGLTRTNTFYLTNGIVPDPTSNGDIIRVQIDIEDVYENVTSYIAYKYVQGYSSSPSLYDLKIYQRNDGSDIVDIYYTYDGLTEINSSYVDVQFSIDNGVTWSDVSTDSLKGDYGNNVMPGRRKVSWQPSLDIDNFTTEIPILCRITLYDVDNYHALGNTLTGYLTWDITKPEIAIRKI